MERIIIALIISKEKRERQQVRNRDTWFIIAPLTKEELFTEALIVSHSKYDKITFSLCQ